MELMIWTTLGVLTYLVAHITVERLLFFGSHPPADSADLETLVLRWTCTGELRTSDVEGRLGWLQSLVAAACDMKGASARRRRGRRRVSALTDPLGPEHAEFLSSLVSVTKAMTVRFLLTLTMARDVAMSMGLLGSVSTLIAMSGPSTGATDPIQSISLALVSTRWGLVIAIVAAVIQPWVITSALRRLDQVAAVQKAVNHIRRTQIGKERDEEGDPPRSSYRSHPIPLVIIDGDK